MYKRKNLNRVVMLTFKSFLSSTAPLWVCYINSTMECISDPAAQRPSVIESGTFTCSSLLQQCVRQTGYIQMKLTTGAALDAADFGKTQ